MCDYNLCKFLHIIKNIPLISRDINWQHLENMESEVNAAQEICEFISKRTGQNAKINLCTSSLF